MEVKQVKFPGYSRMRQWIWLIWRAEHEKRILQCGGCLPCKILCCLLKLL